MIKIDILRNHWSNVDILYNTLYCVLYHFDLINDVVHSVRSALSLFSGQFKCLLIKAV